MEGNELAVIKRDNGIVEYGTDRGRVELSIPDIKRHFCPQATDAEAFVFMEHCVRYRANPFLREIYLIKYGNNPAQIVVGKDYFVRRASQHPMYAGYHAGTVTINKQGQVIYREGAMVFPGETIHGAWCDVHRRDWPKPLRTEALFSEYTTGQSNWKSKPATMIVKVPISQGHRAAFPDLFHGLYEPEEMGVATDEEGNPRVIEARAQTVNAGPTQTVVGVIDGMGGGDAYAIPKTVAELVKYGEELGIPPQQEDKSINPLWAAAIADWGQPRQKVDGYKTVNGKRVAAKVDRDLWTPAQIAEMAERLREEAELRKAEAEAPAGDADDGADFFGEADGAPEAPDFLDAAPPAPGMDGVGEAAPLITAPPPMAQEDLVAALSAEGWTMAKLCKEVLKKSSFSEHQRLGGTVDSAYAAWQTHMLNTLGVKV